MSDSPRVSVLMPVYNAQKYLVEAVESVLGQTFSDFELLVVDDGSTDNSGAVLERFARQDGRIRLVRRPNTGHARALNEMIAMARGELLARMDADDVCLPDRFACQVRFLDEHPEVVCVGGGCEVIDAKGRFLTTTSMASDNDSIQQAMIRGLDAMMHPTMMMRRAAVEQINGYDEATVPSETLDLALKLGEIGSLANLARPVLRYRIHSKSICAKTVDCQLEKLRDVTEAAWRRRGIQAQFEAVSPYREGEDRNSRQSFMLRYGWWAFKSAQRRTAAIYGLKAIAAKPWSWGGWNLLACALLKGRPARPEPAGESPDLTSELIGDVSSWEKLAKPWDELLSRSEKWPSFYLSSLALLPFWKHHGAGRQLAIVVVRDAGGELVGIAPFYVQTVGHRLSRHRRLALLGSPESGCDYLDVIALPGYRARVLREAFECLRRNGVTWDALNLNFILEDSETLTLLAGTELGQRFRLHRQPSAVCPYAVLQPTWEEFENTLGTSTRQGNRKKLKRLRHTFKEIRFERVEDEGVLPEMMQTLIRYKQAKYGHYYDGDYLSWTDQAIDALRAGCLRFLVLRLDGHPACLWFTVQFAGCVFFQACSYDPDYAKFGLGNVLMVHAVELAIREGATVYDMKRGDIEYKYHWSNGERRIIQVNAVRRSLRGAWISFWEYSGVMARLRERVHPLLLKLRRTRRAGLAPLSLHLPGLVLASVRGRVWHQVFRY